MFTSDDTLPYVKIYIEYMYRYIILCLCVCMKLSRLQFQADTEQQMSFSIPAEVLDRPLNSSSCSESSNDVKDCEASPSFENRANLEVCGPAADSDQCISCPTLHAVLLKLHIEDTYVYELFVDGQMIQEHSKAPVNPRNLKPDQEKKND